MLQRFRVLLEEARLNRLVVRDEDPATFACICATLLPKQLEIEDTPGADTHNHHAQ
jgi:hypothetical protein